LAETNWAELEECENARDVRLKRRLLKGMATHTEEQIWAAIVKKKNAAGPHDEEAFDLRDSEYKVFSTPDPALNSRDFKLRAVEPPGDYAGVLSLVVLAERLREVRSLTGFTRLESRGDYAEVGDFPEKQRAPLSRTAPRWVPTSEVRGEGVFLQLSETAIEAWLTTTKFRDGEFFEAHRRWRITRGLDPNQGFPTVRYVLFHSLAHALIRQFSLEGGYTTASIRELIYSRPPSAQHEPMAGILLYTALRISASALAVSAMNPAAWCRMRL
jgi:hypothetical protein